MKGTTELNVTQATIIAAVQLYLDGQFVAGKSPVVTGVKPRNGVGNGDGYSITVEERVPTIVLSRDLELPRVRDEDVRIPTAEDVTAGKELFGDWWQDRFGRWHRRDDVVEQIGGRSAFDEAYDRRMVGGERGQ